MQLLRRAGKRPGIDHADKGVHRPQAIHPPLLRSADWCVHLHTLIAREPQDSAEGFLNVLVPFLLLVNRSFGISFIPVLVTRELWD
jgi:hypothetical protein